MKYKIMIETKRRLTQEEVEDIWVFLVGLGYEKGSISEKE